MGGEFDGRTIEATGERATWTCEDGGSWGIDLGLYRDRNVDLRTALFQQSTGIDSSDPALGSVDVQTEYFQFGGTLLFRTSTGIIPYLSLTIGATRFSAGGYDSETQFSGSLGGGLRMPFNDNVAATLGVRGYLTFVDSDTNFLCVSGGEGPVAWSVRPAAPISRPRRSSGSRCDSEGRRAVASDAARARCRRRWRAARSPASQSAPSRCRAISTTM